jgi:uncharacterized protein YecT (DUF1311 family)
VFLVCNVCYAEFSVSGTCSTELDSQKIYECSKRKRLDADVELNKVYSELNEKLTQDYKVDSKLGEKLKSHIKKSQRAWLIVRDENCAIESFIAAPGTQAFETKMNYCLANESFIRAKYLVDLRL